MDIQAMMDGMSQRWMQQRSETQMTLGKLIDCLESLPPETMVDGITEAHSYRGYYSDLAFENGPRMTAKDALATCRACMGEVFQGYKGGDFQMGRNTPIWRANNCLCGKKIMALKDDGTFELAEDND